MRKTKNLIRSAYNSADHLNKERHPSFSRPLREQFIQALLTNTIENVFYANKNELLKESLDIHEKMLDKDADFYCEQVIKARNEGCMRLQPILGLVYLSTLKNKKLFRKAFHKVIQTPKDLQGFIDLCRCAGIREGIGSSIKKEIILWLNENLTPYWALKYRKAVVDAVRISRPSEANLNSKIKKLVNYLMKDNYIPQITEIQCYEKLKKCKDVSKAINYIEKGRLTHEIVTGAIEPDRKIWEYLIPQLPCLLYTSPSPRD